MSQREYKKRKLVLMDTPPSSRSDGKTHLGTWRRLDNIFAGLGYHPVCVDKTRYYTITTIPTTLAEAKELVTCKACLKKLNEP